MVGIYKPLTKGLHLELRKVVCKGVRKTTCGFLNPLKNSFPNSRWSPLARAL